MAKNTIQKNPRAKDDEVIARIRRIKDSDIDMRDKRTAAAILIRNNSVSRTMQENNKSNETDIDHKQPVKGLLDDIFINNKPIEEVVKNSHDLQEEDPSINRAQKVDRQILEQ